MTTKPNLYAALIVKNEAAVIARTIEAVAPYVRGVVIHDTGSDDDTWNIAQDACDRLGLPLHIQAREWRDYASNRTDLLSSARIASCGEGFMWMLDADEVAAGALPTNLDTADGWHIARVLQCGSEVWGVRIFSNRKPWVYRGATHEVPDCPGAIIGRTHTCWVDNRNDGKQGTQDYAACRDRYYGDADHFADLCRADHRDTRSAYYLAQSLKDGSNFAQLNGDPAPRHGEAFAAYQRRGLMTDGFAEERYIALLMVARYLRGWTPSRPVTDVVRAYQAAIECRTSRHEAMVELAGYLNDRADDAARSDTVNPGLGLAAISHASALAAMAWAHRAYHLPPSGDLFLVHRPSHQWLPGYELARSSELAGWDDVARAMAQHLLGTCATIGETECATLERIARHHEPPR